MKPFQKVIKYLAIAFAIFLIVNIFSGIIFFSHIFANVLGLTKEVTSDKANYVISDFTNNSIDTLNIRLESSDLILKSGDVFKTETSSENVICKQDNNQLTIEEKDTNLFLKDIKDEAVIYIPKNIVFDKVNIETGTGNVEIDTLKSKELFLELGIGKTSINNLYVSNKAKLKGGVGKVSILNAEISNLDLEVGIGAFEIWSKLTGDNLITAGIGSLNICLIDKIENHTIHIDKGIGPINLNGKNVSDDSTYGSGTTSIKVAGGIGNIVIKECD